MDVSSIIGFVANSITIIGLYYWIDIFAGFPSYPANASQAPVTDSDGDTEMPQNCGYGTN